MRHVAPTWSWILITPLIAIPLTLLAIETEGFFATPLGHGERSPWLDPLFSIVIQIFMCAVPAFILHRIHGIKREQSFPLQKLPFVLIASIITATIGLNLFASSIHELYSQLFGITSPNSDDLRFNGLFDGLWVFLDSSIAPSFTEEIFFRGYLLGVFLQVTSPLKSSLWVSLVFALLHVDLGALPFYFIAGLWFSWLRIRFQSLWAPLVAHAVGNALAILYENIPLPSSIPLDSSIGIGLAGLGIWWLRQHLAASSRIEAQTN